MSSPAGNASNPTRRTCSQNPGSVANATAWPAARKARASGTIGLKCPDPTTHVKRTRIPEQYEAERRRGSRRAGGYGANVIESRIGCAAETSWSRP